MGQNNDFLQKSGLKTLILAVMVLDQLTLEWAGTQNLKVSLFPACVLKKVEHQFRNELWASHQTSILSDRRPLEIFFGAVMKKC